MWNAGAVALTAALTIITVHQATRWELIRSLDELLVEDAEEIRLALKDLPVESIEFQGELNRKAMGHRRHEWFVKLLSDDGNLIWASVNAPSKLLAKLDTTGNHFTTTGTFRQYTRNVSDDSTVRWLRIGASMDPLTQELHRIDRIAIFTWLLSLIIAPILGWLLSGRALNPLRTMVHTAAMLRPSLLSERLPIRDAGDELDQLAKTINTLLDRIATDVGEKHDFLANAAHELRTPLAAIRATADVALVSDRSVVDYRDLVAQIMEQTDALGGIVNQLLLLAESSLPTRIDSRKPFALNEIVSKSADIFRAVAECSDVSLKIDRNDAVTMIGNRDQWIQVLNNLLDNAIKYSPTGGRVAVDLRCIETQGSKARVQLSISDTGIGVHADDVERIFDRFYRADRSRTRLTDVSGTGLGLSICKAVVESHGGTIRCTSRLGQGTVFMIQLPLEASLEKLK